MASSRPEYSINKTEKRKAYGKLYRKFSTDCFLIGVHAAIDFIFVTSRLKSPVWRFSSAIQSRDYIARVIVHKSK